MNRLPAILFILLFSSGSLLSQNRHTVSGYVRDSASGEYCIGANIYLREILKGTSTNTYGFYSMTVDDGDYTLVISYLGYHNFEKKIKLDKDIRLNISLGRMVFTTGEVVITGEAQDKNVKSTDIGTVRMDVREIKQLPVVFGEVDVLKAIQLLPGVQAAGEGSSGFYVRGGGPDQNLILLDEAIVYNAGHLFGFFSVFNPDAVKDINLIKGGMPANYGGRLASVLDIAMKEGNSKKFEVDGGIGVISSRLALQGPVKKDTCSYIVTARRTYIDVLVKPFVNDTSMFKGSGYYFYDLNGKINYRISDRDRLFLSGYYGKDVFTFKSEEAGFEANIPWGNATGSLRWNHLHNKKLFMNTTAVYSDYKFEFIAEQDNFGFRLFSGIRDWTLKSDFNYFPSVLHNIKFGGIYIYHTFIPGNVSARINEDTLSLNKIIRQYAHEGALYVNDDFDITEWLKVNAGIRYSLFRQVGPFTRYRKNEIDQIVDSVVYKRGERVADYSGIEPRISMRILLNKSTSFKASYTHNYQYLHLAAISSISMPTDLWVPSSDRVKPQFGIQYAGGIFKNLRNNIFETSVEVYYKTMENMVEFAEGAAPESSISDNTDNSFVFGEGKSYGAEFFIAKRKGKFHGWIGYTLSKTTRTFPDINDGEEFYAKYDRRHDFEVIANYSLNSRWTFSAVFVYATGNTATMPVDFYLIEGNVVTEYGKRNSYRMPDYHRMDLSATWNLKPLKVQSMAVENSLVFSIYNLYNRLNPYFIYIDYDGDALDGDLTAHAKLVSVFPILPSVTWNFRF